MICDEKAAALWASFDRGVKGVKSVKGLKGEMKAMLFLHGATLSLVAMLAINPAAAQETPAAGASRVEQAVPLIQLNRVPLSDAIRNLARHADFNYILAPRITSSPAGRETDPAPEPIVTARWTNLTAHQALCFLLKDHKLAIVTNPATSVARIALSSETVSPVAASQAGSDTNPPISLVRLDATPLAQAIREIAGQEQLKVVLNPDLPVPSSGPGETTVSAATVSVLWKNIRPRQALAALLDNYDLTMVEDRATSSAWIMKKERPAAEGVPKRDPTAR